MEALIECTKAGSHQFTSSTVERAEKPLSLRAEKGMGTHWRTPSAQSLWQAARELTRKDAFERVLGTKAAVIECLVVLLIPLQIRYHAVRIPMTPARLLHTKNLRFSVKKQTGSY
jgi:hypothetical protein